MLQQNSSILIDKRFRDSIDRNSSYENAFEHLYWQAAGKDYKTGKKSYTLTVFEEKYKDEFIRFAQFYSTNNLYSKFKSLPKEDRENQELVKAMRHFDYTVNIKWVMAHYNTANHYLNIGGKTADATGGSEWVKYMHPKYQKRIFFPEFMDKTRIRRMGNKYLVLLLVVLVFISCKEEVKVPEIVEEKPADIYEFGFNLSDFVVKRDTIRSGDSFGAILDRNKIEYPKIFSIAEKARDTFDIRRLQIGKPYTLLCSKDSLERPKCFIYQPNMEEYVVINFQDSIHAYTSRKPIKYVEKTVTGVLNTSISETLDKKGISPILTNMLAEQIYAWTIDFTRLQKGDTFKVIYTDKYIDDTIYAGIQNVKAAYFNHKNSPYYAFRYGTDSIKNIYEYYNEDAKDLRRAFLKAPVQFSRISSRYNLNRRIAYYGFALRPHKGTDFAAPIGTPILATANGTVTESQYKGGNGNYVKIRHNCHLRNAIPAYAKTQG